MSWPSAVVVFVISWWLFFFMLLPVGIRTQGEARDAGEGEGAVVPGTPESAPVRPRLWWKAGLATLLALLAVGLFALVQRMDLISFRA